MNKLLVSGFKVLFFLGIGIGILWLLYNNLNAKYIEDCATRGIPESACSLIDKVTTDLKSANVYWLLVITVCFIISNISRTIRWRQFIRPLGYDTNIWNGFHAIMLGYFANLGFPRLGEPVRAGTFAKYEKIAFEKVMGTVVLDRVLDLIFFALVFLLALFLQFETLWTYITTHATLDLVSIFNSNWVKVLLLILLAGILATWFYRNLIMASKVFFKLKHLLAGFMDGLSSIRKVESLPWLFFHSVVIWLMYYLMTYLCFQSFAPTSHLGPLAGLLVFVFGSLGIIIPTPGGMGSYHALVMAALALYGVGLDDAFSFAMIIFFTINIFGNVLFGVIALLFLPGYNRNYQPVRT
ncbi:MAG: flippase-like domain-containing protein [Saprospiraceae bacterium]|nr:flippase-like domain-containing protein [Saprospiraceae bacterium]